MKPEVVIIDYGMGNLFNLEKVVTHCGGRSVVTQEPEPVLKADRVILPGVGAFGDGMVNLKARHFVEAIQQFALTGKPLLGICLGMQLLLSDSEEFGLHEGLDLIPGHVRRLQNANGGTVHKIPHVGWNRLRLAENAAIWKESVLRDVPVESCVYFVHSFMVQPQERSHIVAETDYGINRFCSVVKKENLTGCQFHPEVSADVGMTILKNFIHSV